MKYSSRSLSYRADRASSKSRIGCALTLSILGLLSLAGTAMAIVQPVILLRPSPGNCYQLYVPTTGDKITLLGTEKMRDAIIGDVDGDGLEDDLVYRDATQADLRYYKLSGDGAWNPSLDFGIRNASRNTIPLTIVRTSGSGSVGLIVYNYAPTGRTYCIKPDGTGGMTLGYMDRAYAADVRSRGYDGDLVWWKSGKNMRWREGVRGIDHVTPYSDWVPLGEGRFYSDQPNRVIAFYASKERNPKIYVCDRNWAYTRIDGTNWPWCMNGGSLVIGDIDGVMPYSEIAFVQSPTDPLRWYNPPLTSSGTWDPLGMATADSVQCGWNLAGVGKVDLTPASVVSISRIADLAGKSDGTMVQVTAKPRTKLVRELGTGLTPMVTGYYIEEPDRGAGIRVVGTTTPAEGQPIAVRGRLDTLNGERAIVATDQTISSGSSVIAPLQSTVQAVLGTAAMTGLLVQLTGAISAPTSGWFNLVDGLQNTIKIYCADPVSLTGQIAVTGCVGAEKVGSAVVRVLRVAFSSDVAGVSPPSPPEPPAPPPPSPVQSKYSVWTRSSLERVFKDDAAKSLNAPILKAGRNEYESFQIVMRAGSSQINSITLSAGDLYSANGTIPASNVSLYLPWYIRLQTLSKDYPDPLPPYQGAYNLAAGQTRPIWVQVYVPRSVPAGDYNGLITIKDASGAITYVPYGVHVYDFTLPSSWKCQTAVGMRGDNIAAKHGVSNGSAAYNALVKKYYEFLLNYGLSAYNLPVDIMSSDADKYLADPRVSSFAIPYGSYNTTTVRNYINKVKTFSGAWDKAYFDGPDECKTLDGFAKIRSDANFVHSVDPASKLMSTITANSIGVDPYSYLAGYTDIWCTASSWITSSNLSKINSRQAAGDTAWSYYCYGVPRQQWAQIYLDCATTSFPMIFWQNYNAKITGWLYWDSIYWQYTSDPWTNLQYPLEAAIYGEGIMLYPGNKVGIDGPVGSIRLELIRDGLEDYQKCWMLEQKSGRSAVTPIVQKVTTSYTSWTRDPNVLQSARDELADKLEN